ncbi:hypothetical protein EVAR_16342_1 [Eumeta japonica]|uniref:Uncharacterized protein n=1 Tax=Eumeta variegata TaxID=151549 RepID=A0A4C1VGK2_EUMVA|nr:hypothetical protein EVAR_16342_1 [Eumeta japonica]
MTRVPVVPPPRSVAFGPIPGPPFSSVCYRVSVFLRAVFRSAGLRASMSVCGTAQCTSRGNGYATFEFVTVICSDSPHRLHAEAAHGFCA